MFASCSECLSKFNLLHSINHFHGSRCDAMNLLYNMSHLQGGKGLQQEEWTMAAKTRESQENLHIQEGAGGECLQKKGGGPQEPVSASSARGGRSTSDRPQHCADSCTLNGTTASGAEKEISIGQSV